MTRRRAIVVALVGVAIVGLAATSHNPDKKSALLSGPNDTEIALFPSEKNAYGPVDIRLRLTIPRAFLHQRGEVWAYPLNEIGFALNTIGFKSTSLSPLDDPSVILVSTKITTFDHVDAGINKTNKRYVPIVWGMEHIPLKSMFGLNYFTVQTYPGAPLDEYLFDSGPLHNLEIHCQPSGNITPTLCFMKRVGPRGGGVNPNSIYAPTIDVIFRRERLEDWSSIVNDVDRFLSDKLHVMRWDN